MLAANLFWFNSNDDIHLKHENLLFKLYYKFTFKSSVSNIITKQHGDYCHANILAKAEKTNYSCGKSITLIKKIKNIQLCIIFA
jgi:hypothetical protein